jgi:GNAT superfamily N-acetyltransferase
MNLIRRAVQRRESYAMWIERYEPCWHSQVIELATVVFGEGYFSEPWLQTRQPDSMMFLAHDDIDGLYGFAHGRILPKDGLRPYLGPAVGDFPPDVRDADAAGNLAVIDVVAVAANHRRQGIGFTLLRATHDALVGAGADKLLVTFKRGPRAAPVEGIMRRLGFTLWRKLPTYWRDQCNRGEFKCVDRQDRCVCEAMIFRKSVY